MNECVGAPTPTLIQNEWRRRPGTFEFVVGSEAVLRAAGLREPRALAAELGMGMVCLITQRRAFLPFVLMKK